MRLPLKRSAHKLPRSHAFTLGSSREKVTQGALETYGDGAQTEVCVASEEVLEGSWHFPREEVYLPCKLARGSYLFYVELTPSSQI